MSDRKTQVSCSQRSARSSRGLLKKSALTCSLRPNQIPGVDPINQSWRANLNNISQSDPYLNVAAFAPGGEFLLTRSSARVNLHPFGAADECLTLAGHRVSVPGIAFSPDGARLASVAKDRTVVMWDAVSGQRRIKRG